MAIAYLFTLEELAVLAHFSGEQALVGFEALPSVDTRRCDQLLADLHEKGMATVSADAVSLPAPLKLMISVLARPELSVRAIGDIWIHCTADLGVLVTRAPHSKTRMRVLPLPTARELAEHLWEEAEICFEQSDFVIYRGGEAPAKATLSQAELQEILLQTYREEEAD